MMQASPTGLLRGGVSAPAALVIGVAVIRIVCRRPALRRLPFALSLVAPSERLSKTPARRQAERDDVISRAASAEYEGPGADRASHLLPRRRRFFGLVSDPAGRG